MVAVTNQTCITSSFVSLSTMETDVSADSAIPNFSFNKRYWNFPIKKIRKHERDFETKV